MVVNNSTLFDANFYRTANPDLAAGGLTTDAQLFSHFQNYGLSQGRAFSPLVDLNFYRASNPDLGGLNNVQAFADLQNSGISQGRRFSQVFDLNFYRNANSDLNSLNNEQLFQHLGSYGINEGRQFSQFFDLNYYKGSNPDLVQKGFNNIQLLQHFQLYGLKEGRKFDPAFDVNYYRSLNRDLAPNLTNQQLLEDFESKGLEQGRISSPTFNVKVYLANNPDLVAAGYNNQQAYTHFVQYGQNEGRAGNYYQANTLDTARDITSSLLTKTWTDFVGDIHNNDYYKFNLVESSTNLTIAVNNFNADVNVQLIKADNNGTALIDSAASRGAVSEAINRRYLAAGTYYIRVSSGKGSNTNYDLNVSLLGNPDLGGAPNNQSWLSFGTIPNAQPTIDPNTDPNADPNTNTQPTNVVNLPIPTGNGGFDSTQDLKITGGYSSYNNDGQLNPQFPTLDHNTGFTIDFDAKVNTESHNSNDQAGFDVVALDNFRLGIELGFWNNQIWAKQITFPSDGSVSLIHDNVEQVARDTTVATRYELSIVDNTYKLFADGSPILTGNIKNYTPYKTTDLAYNPYQKPNYFFIGDNSATAGANIDLPFVGVSKT